MAEFLPLCDVLFNVISLAGYFCDVVFDVVMGYALLERGYKRTFAAAMSIIVTSLVISQVLSLRWYLHVCSDNNQRKGRGPWAPVILHCLQLGILWRYARLFIPVDLGQVKHQVRDLCMLRLVHAFCEAAPMLLLQLYVFLVSPEPDLTADLLVEPTRDEPEANKAFAELNVISASLSLFSVCWALASFSKNVRLQNVHRLVLTWLGVIFQFLWRLGTVSARVCALTAYALVYDYWVFLVIGLHWVSMFLWLMTPKNVFDGERISRPRKAYLSALIAFVYVFAYINLQDNNHRQKMITFYCVMIVENCLLLGASLSVGGAPAAFTLGATVAGLAFMCLYYRYFHVRRLGYLLGDNQQGTNSTNASNNNKGKSLGGPDNAAIPGVFNCRFTNPVGNSGANARKKKKPTSFVPPPAAAAFWRRPLPPAHNHHGGSSENEGSSVGSRVNIQQKLQEKKQKQLAELRVIEEEIKQGKLAKTAPVAVEEIYSSLQRQPIPRSKTHAEPSWPSIEIASYQNYPIVTNNIYPTYTEIKQSFDFQNTEASTSNEIRRQNKIYTQDNSRTFYDNPTQRNERSRTYLALGDTRSYENGCGSPRNVINKSPRNYPDVSQNTNSYERPIALDKPRIPTNNIYEATRPIGEYSGYCENKNSYNKYESKDNYVSALENALSSVQSIDNMRNYNESQYGQGGERFYMAAKSKLDQMRKMQRCRTPEILLAPHYLEGCNRQVCCHWGAPTSYNIGNRPKEESAVCSSGEESNPEETPRPASDIDSQISLPRSYTLPREFRYWRRRQRLRDHAPSNNSSDGDVDSADNDSDRRSTSSQVQNPTYSEGFPYRHAEPNDDDRRRLNIESGLYGPDRRRRPFRKQITKPETKL